MDQWTPSEKRTLRALNTPAKIQNFLDKIPYNLDISAWSPRRVLRNKTAHCFEGAVFAAAALRFHGFKPLIFDLEATQDTDHVVALYQQSGAWGAIAMSNYPGCRFRSAIYRSLRELALSYFEDYFNMRGQRTLRNYSGPVNLSRFDKLNWMTTEKKIWFIAEHLCDIPHTPLLTPRMVKNLVKMDKRSFEAGIYGKRTK